MIGEICDPADPVTGKRSTRRAPSTDVDHIVPKEQGGTDDEENLQGACHACHSWKTATQDSTFAKKKT
jgi:5-methylcytosine-specific restriction endonuclease McrA